MGVLGVVASVGGGTSITSRGSAGILGPATGVATSTSSILSIVGIVVGALALFAFMAIIGLGRRLSLHLDSACGLHPRGLSDIRPGRTGSVRVARRADDRLAGAPRCALRRWRGVAWLVLRMHRNLVAPGLRFFRQTGVVEA